MLVIRVEVPCLLRNRMPYDDTSEPMKQFASMIWTTLRPFDYEATHTSYCLNPSQISLWIRPRYRHPTIIKTRGRSKVERPGAQPPHSVHILEVKNYCR